MRNRSILPKILLSILLLEIINGCAALEMNSVIASWQGQPAAEVTAAWGPPSENLQIEGKQLLIWYNYAGRPVAPDMKRPLPHSASDSCTRLLQADRTGRVVSGTWEGDDCPGWFSGWRR
jgi:hypothetical protein